MAKYRLMSAHHLEAMDTTRGSSVVLGDKEMEQVVGELERGTVVGDGTPWRVKWPTLEMVPLDDEAEAALEKERERLQINDGVMDPVENLPLDSYEKNYIPGLNIRRREPLPDGTPVGAQK